MTSAQRTCRSCCRPDRGLRAYNLFLDSGESECLSLINNLRDSFLEEVEIFIDELRLHSPKAALIFPRQLEQRVRLARSTDRPENLTGHRRLTVETRIRIAIGEPYNTRFELLPIS